jgi:hypothetical protein
MDPHRPVRVTQAPAPTAHLTPEWTPRPTADPTPETDELSKLKEERRRYDEFVKLVDVNCWLIALFSQEFAFKDYKFTFMRELKKDWGGIGRYKPLKNRTMLMGGSKNARVELVCSNVLQLVHMAQTLENQYVGVFVTPAVCTLEDMDALNETQLGNLKEVA